LAAFACLWGPPIAAPTKTGVKNDPIFEVEHELERIALQDDYFIEKELFPNIDFYSGITVKALVSPPPCSRFCSPIALQKTWLSRMRRPASRESSASRILT
jgi:citrate synthase